MVPKYTHLPQYEREIGRLFRQNGYQIVHSHMNTLSVLSLWGAKRAGVPNRIAHNHSTVGRGEGAKNVMKYLLRPFATVYPTRLCACSRTAGSWLYGEKPFRVFNNAIELDRFTYDASKRKAVRQELGLGDELVLGHVGRFCYAKNHEFLLDVMAEVCKQRPDAVLLLIGEGESEAAARRKAEALGLQRNVRFLGRQSDPAKFYQAMDAFVLPSRYEGLGIVLIEAQAAALPVICSAEVPQEAQVLPEMQYLSLQESPAVWADAAIRAAENARRRDTSAEMRAGGFDIVTEAKKLEEFYFDLLK